MTLFLESNIDRFQSVGNTQFGDGADFDAGHMRDTRDDIRAHLARADQADAHGPPTIRTRLHVTRQTCQRHIGCHRFLLNLPAKILAVSSDTLWINEHLFLSQYQCSFRGREPEHPDAILLFNFGLI